MRRRGEKRSKSGGKPTTYSLQLADASAFETKLFGALVEEALPLHTLVCRGNCRRVRQRRALSVIHTRPSPMSAKPFPGEEVLVCRSVPSRRPIAHREKGQAGLLARTQFKSSQHVERALKGQIPPVGFLRRCFIRSQV